MIDRDAAVTYLRVGQQRAHIYPIRTRSCSVYSLITGERAMDNADILENRESPSESECPIKDEMISQKWKITRFVGVLEQRQCARNTPLVN